MERGYIYCVYQLNTKIKKKGHKLRKNEDTLDDKKHRSKGAGMKEENRFMRQCQPQSCDWVSDVIYKHECARWSRGLSRAKSVTLT